MDFDNTDTHWATSFEVLVPCHIPLYHNIHDMGIP
jgi:hypothetical protein